jgi:RimJ/RimL family protein N-acetyltransferase
LSDPRASDGIARCKQRCVQRIELIPLSEGHLDHEVELDSDAEVMRYLGDGLSRRRAQVQEVPPAQARDSGALSGAGLLGRVVEREFVGWWGSEPPQRADQGPVSGQAELGYRLLRRYWRRGLASEGAREVLRHGFEDLRLTRIFAETMAVNVASRATMTSIGLRHVRTFYLDFDEPLPGSELGEVEYAILREQWVVS